MINPHGMQFSLAFEPAGFESHGRCGGWHPQITMDAAGHDGGEEENACERHLGCTYRGVETARSLIWNGNLSFFVKERGL